MALFVFHYRAPFSKQLALLEAVRAGAAVYGDTVIGHEGFDGVLPDVDGLVLFGIGGHSRNVFDAYLDAGKRVVFWDKGYSRGGSGYFRVAVDAFQPLAYFQRTLKPDDRFERLKTDLKPYKPGGTHILFDGASNKYCIWQGLGDWQEWGSATFEQTRRHTARPVIYRPRPSHNFTEPFAPLADEFARAAVVVSYGGNIGWDAVIAGVPHFAIGDSIARPVSETDWARLDVPRVPSEGERLAWCSAVAYQQWTVPETASGEAWGYIKQELG